MPIVTWSSSITAESLQPRFLAGIDEISAAEWNALAGDYPFTRHEFLSALERTGCVGLPKGWEPHHLLLNDAQGLAIAAPVYLKHHSWGEFVFDFAWAQAWEARGLEYYPKLLLAIPFTPATGPRWLSRAGMEPAVAGAAVLAALRADCHGNGWSSAHGLFLDDAGQASAERAGWLLRRDCQFRWHNQGYQSFEHFLAGFTADKRKKVKRERRRIAEQGIQFRTLMGGELDARLIRHLYRFHATTFRQHGHEPYLNEAFFTAISRDLGDAFMVKLALQGEEPVAAALYFRSRDTLYGRYWGANEEFHSLHFEACYYQGIEYCIEQGIATFEPGTQGEHKLARGFSPTYTWSAHWLENAPLRAAVAAWLKREDRAVEGYAVAASDHLPFRHPRSDSVC